MFQPEAVVVGAGLSGCEAAWGLAQRGIRVALYEQRPIRTTPAHTTDLFAELVCSNSLKSKSPTSPAGQLKAEMTALGSLVLACAMQNQVPAGEALGVDRELFGKEITGRLEQHANVEVLRIPYTTEQLGRDLNAGLPVILATGPLTSDDLSQTLASITGRKRLYFYDAVSPTVEASSIDLSIAFAQSRYDKGGDDYLNCPFNKEEYLAFVQELKGAERAPFHAFEAGGKRDGGATATEDQLLENIKYFSGCTPIEAIADKGDRSLAFGNFKPVGLEDPRTGRRPYAALQLRPENTQKSMYSLVACQTRLKWGEQKRVFRMVPGLQNAEFVRYGVIHRNTFLDAPQVLNTNLELCDCPNLFVTGQLTGVEGYVESAAMGIWSALTVLARLKGQELPPPPRTCAYGSLLDHISDKTDREFAPMNINWGLFPVPELETKDKGGRRSAQLAAAQQSFGEWLHSHLGGTGFSQ